jgi:tRNA threonylcarbamoyladenosine biosynthesis protein TsaB
LRSTARAGLKWLLSHFRSTAGYCSRYLLKILALETSSEYCSVALWRDGESDAREVHVGQGHSERVLDMVDALLSRHRLRVTALDGIAFGEGPGSFTGLRIACGVTQGLAFAAGIPVLGVSSLLAMAESTQSDRVLCCVDARMREIYHATYERAADTWHTVQAPGVYAPAAAPQLPEGTWFGCGNGFAAYRETLMRRYEPRLDAVDVEIHPRAEEVARLAVPRFERGEGGDAAAAAPLYVRDKVALKMYER